MSELETKLDRLRIDRAAPPRRTPWRWLVALAIVAVVAVVAWRVLLVPGATVVRTAPATVLQSIDASERLPLLTASGYVVARREAVVSSKIQGRLAELRVEEGDRVEADEIIARLEDADARAAVGSAEAGVARAEAAIGLAEANLAEARRQERNAVDLFDAAVGTDDAVEAARSGVRQAEAAAEQARRERDVAQAQVGVARAALANTVIRAPFAGTVVKKMAEVGESVAPIPPGVNISTASGAIVALADLDTLEVEVDVAEAQVSRLSEGQPARVTVEAFADRPLRGRLRQVIPTADRTKATVLVKVTILDDDPRLKPEMSAKADFLEPEAAGGGATGEEGPFVTVPDGVVTRRDGHDVVFTVADGHAAAVEVTLGRRLRGGVVIERGLTGGERVAVDPPDGLADGDAVRVE